jgi:hypothetical protein
MAAAYTEAAINDELSHINRRYPPIPPKLPITASTDTINIELRRQTTGIAGQNPRQRMEPITHELDTSIIRAHVRTHDFRSAAPFSPATLEAMEDGLHVSKLEQGITARCIEDLIAADGELEVENAESDSGGGFQR